MGVVLEYARERFLERRQQVRQMRERQALRSWRDLDPVLIATPTGVQTADWRTLNPDEDDGL